MGIFPRWFVAIAHRQKMRLLFSLKQRQFLSVRMMEANQIVKQVQHAWFDYQRTFSIKVKLFIRKKTHNLLRHWFVYKRKPLHNWLFKKAVGRTIHAMKKPGSHEQ
jgi:hypothetical protein